jgi:hydrogenase maturation protein HypF
MKYTKITLPYKIKSGVLAFGAQSKSAFCFAKGNIAYLSGSGGDLSDLGNFKKFENQIKLLQKKFNIKPDIIACDLHPEYISTKLAHDWAKGTPYHKGTGQVERRVKKIQHHEAHVVSCIADNDIKGRVIGVAFDGAGFGPDGNIWGGEFFIGGAKGFKRAAHLKYIAMPGAEASIKEPWRMAFSYLYDIYGKDTASKILNRLDKKKMDILEQAVDKKINSPLTSSVGRLFDGISSIIGICDFAGYEGEAAIKLEKIIQGIGHPALQGYGAGRAESGYSFKYKDENGIIIIDWGPTIRGVARDLKAGVKKPEISLKFHNAICDMIKDVCNILKKKYKIKKVCMSGGVFQNKYLSGRLKPMLVKEGFNVYGHKKVPTHDGGIALGQAILAYQRLHSDNVRV